mgnify:CR=1 FL=1
MSISKITVLCLLLVINLFSKAANVDTWVQKTDFPGPARINAVSFSVRGQAFIGTGEDSQGNLLNDFWKYDPDLNAWSQVADFGGTARKGAVGFALDTLGYVGTGYDGTLFFKDFWSFNPISNSWQIEQELGLYTDPIYSSGRRDAVAVVALSKAYIMCGYDGSSGYVKQTWQFDPTADTCWTLKRNLANVSDIALFGRRWSVGFAIQDTVYLGTGFSFSQDLKKDFWKYNPLLDAWTQIADFGGDFRSNAIAFSLYNKGYVGCGISNSYENDVWRYDPFHNDWTAVASYGGSPICNGISFIIGNRAFAGLGNDSLYATQSDVWEYIPDSTSGIGELENNSVFTAYPNPVVDYLEINSTNFFPAKNTVCEIYSSSGQLCLQTVLSNSRTQLDLQSFSSGVYFYSITLNTKKITCRKFIKK